jgi:hypothetical protein
LRRIATRPAALHVDDLAVADRQDLIALVLPSVITSPRGRADDLVVADHRELGLYPDWPTALLDLERQDLTGLVRAPSGWGVLPPEVTVGGAAPFCIVGEEKRERLRITLIQRLRCHTKLIDHAERSRRLSGTRPIGTLIRAPVGNTATIR